MTSLLFLLALALLLLMFGTRRALASDSRSGAASYARVDAQLGNEPDNETGRGTGKESGRGVAMDFDSKIDAEPYAEFARKPGERIRLEKLYNLRDLGGYPCADGRKVKRGLLYRSDDLSMLTDSDLISLNGLGVRTVVDFRADREHRTNVDRLPDSVSREVHLPIQAGNVNSMQRYDPAMAAAKMRDIYRSLVHEHQETYRTFFGLVQDADNAPLLFHCSAGKDRTGYAAMLIYAALGVAPNLVMLDYMISAAHAEERYEELISGYPELKPFFTVEESYLEVALSLIAEEYGGVERYMVEHLDIDVERMRELYSE